MDGYVAASNGGELTVSVGVDGVPLGVHLSAAAMHLHAEELAARIIRLNTLARLRYELATDQAPNRDGEDQGARRSSAQVAAYAQSIDF